MSLQDHAAIVGVAVARAVGPNTGLTVADLALVAAGDALADAGLTRAELDGVTGPSGAPDPGVLANQLGAQEVGFSTFLTSGAGGGAGAIGLAAAAVHGGFSQVCLSLLQVQAAPRTGGRSANALFRPRPTAAASAYVGVAGVTPDGAFTADAGIDTYGIAFALTANAYLHRYGVSREQLGGSVVRARANAGEELALDDYLAAPVVVDPLSELDAAPGVAASYVAAAVVTSAARAKDLRHPAVLVSGAAQGGAGIDGAPWQGPAELVASSGHGLLATSVYAMAGIGPGDVDVALLDDDFSPMVLMQLEDYGFCGRGESTAFLADASLPVNPHGGNFTEAFARGETHVVEAVEQLRGTAARKVPGAEVALVTGDPGVLPLSATVLRRA